MYAAISGVYLKSRVALVEQPFKEHLGSSERIYNHTLMQAAWLFQQLSSGAQLGIYTQNPDLEETSYPLIRLDEVKSWAEEVVSTIKEQNSLAILASLGVDVINSGGEFCRLPYQAFMVNDRRLRSRAYLIATGSHPIVPDIQGIQEIGYLTSADIWQQDNLMSLANNLAVIGASLKGIELAQSLARLGKNVSLIVEDERILPQEDPEASMLIQAQLEGEGVQIFTQSSLTQVRSIGGKKWLQAGNIAIETDEIILAMGQKPNVEGLNLEGVGVKLRRQGIQVNEKLQTTNSQIYACGDVIGGYQLTHIAQYEAKIALKNALFFPLFTVDYHTIPWVLFSDPSLARVGMSEAQARGRYGEDVLVIKQYFKSIPQAHIFGETTGFCKLVLRGNGEIVGAHIVGLDAQEFISTIALAMKKKIKLGAIADLPFPSPSLSEIVQKTAIKWRRDRLKQNKRLQNLLASFFNLRRNWG
ncbi:MAG: FAD-dependent oxidoreductase [Moorea sp. SIO2B7]|nr:FAD-dependent oxidoreductase [Moorena sp. SIO2B7]